MMQSELRGYPEFQKALTQIDRDMPKVMRDAAIRIAQDWVAAAKGNAQTPQQSLAAQTLMVGPTEEAGGSIVADSPVFFGAEFGGQTRPSTMQFQPFQGKRGYFFYPAGRDNKAHFDTLWSDAIDKGMKSWDRKDSF